MRFRRYGVAVSFARHRFHLNAGRTKSALTEIHTARSTRVAHLEIFAPGHAADTHCQNRPPDLGRAAPLPFANGAPTRSPDLPATSSHDPCRPLHRAR